MKAIKLLILFLVVFACVSSAVAQEEKVPAKPDRVIFIAPLGGAIRHELAAMGRSPALTDWGPMTGLFFGYMRKNLSLIAFPYWADANGCYVYGAVVHLDVFFTNNWWQPMVGFGGDVTKIDDKNASMVDINVFAPWSKLGMRFNTPIKGFSVTPYLGYLFQLVDTKWSESTYNTMLYGINLNYNRGPLMAALKYYYGYDFDGRNIHSLKLQGGSLITKRIGFYAKIEYARQVVDEYLTFLAGPSIVF